MKIHYLTSGSCEHPEFIALRGGGLRPVVFPSLVVAIEHPKFGVILFDTGYSPRFHEQTRKFPEKIYALVTPVKIREEDTAVARLRALGISSDDVRFVICSHFHADHIGGVADFKRAKYIYMSQGLEKLLSSSRMGQIRRGFLRGLLPADFKERSVTIESLGEMKRFLPYQDFHSGWDVLGDQSLIAVSLPGHADGQLGLIIRGQSGHPDFLVADAAWSSQAIRENRLPNGITRILFTDFRDYARTLTRLHNFGKLHPEVRLIPCHCGRTHGDLGADSFSAGK